MICLQSNSKSSKSIPLYNGEICSCNDYIAYGNLFKQDFSNLLNIDIQWIHGITEEKLLKKIIKTVYFKFSEILSR